MSSELNIESFNIKNYVIDFDRVNEISNNSTEKEINEFVKKKEYSSVSGLLLTKLVGDFLKAAAHEDLNRLINTDKGYFLINTLIYNKILVKPRVSKIEKILKEA